MKVWIYHTNSADYIKNLIDVLRGRVQVVSDYNQADICLVTQMGANNDLSLLASQMSKPFVTYVWDCYEWIWQEGLGNDWAGLGNLCIESAEVWVPSEGQRDRLVQHWGIDKDKSRVVKAYAQLFSHPTGDDGYICNPLRNIPDRHADWAEQATKDLKLDYRHGGRKRGHTGMSWDNYKKFIANSRFIVCPWYEASTGGMSLLEGYALGKEVLICNSPYMGAKDYFGERAWYFDPDFDDFVEAIESLYHEATAVTSPEEIEERKEFCVKEFSIYTMADNIAEGLQRVLDEK